MPLDDDHRPPPARFRDAPPPLTVAASLAGLEAVFLLGAAVLEAFSLTEGRMAMGLSTAAFFAGYGVLLVVSAWALSRGATWARGPVLLTQLIALGLAWNVRDVALVAVVLVVVALVTVAGVLHPDSIEALERDPQARPDA
ncbi:MAG: hypothetical protein CMH83_22505 [Nocardioides sp.]|nr:hypothetical protein [Nocardioides sp.]